MNIIAEMHHTDASLQPPELAVSRQPSLLSAAHLSSSALPHKRQPPSRDNRTPDAAKKMLYLK